MKRLFTLLLTMSLFTSLTAQAAGSAGLKQAFDEFNFALNVEWDQKNMEDYKVISKNFTDAVAKLQAEGLTNQEMVDFALAQVPSETTKKALEAKMLEIKINNMSKTEARTAMMEALKESNIKGANWSGAGAALLASLGVILIVAAILGSSSTTYGGGYSTTCYDEYVCYDYYDSWGYYMYTDCYYETYCY